MLVNQRLVKPRSSSLRFFAFFAAFAFKL